jgi:hypothetical protein
MTKFVEINDEGDRQRENKSCSLYSIVNKMIIMLIVLKK